MCTHVTRVIDFSFSAQHVAFGALTCGQSFMAHIYQALGQTWPDQNCGFLIELTEKLNEAYFDSKAIELVEKYESLRSCFTCQADGILQQTRLSAGSVLIRYVDSELSNCKTVARSLYEQMLSEFIALDDLPIRIGYVRSDGAVQSVIVVLSHMAVDGYSLTLLRNEFQRILTHDSKNILLSSRQPLEQADWERSPMGKMIIERSTRYWRNELSKFPFRMFDREIGSSISWDELDFHSMKMGDCVEILSCRLKLTKATIMTAAICCSFAKHAGTEFFATTIYTANRHHRGMQNIIGNIAQVSPLHIDITDDFESTCRTLGAKLFSCCRHGLIDSASIESIVDGGIFVELDNRINILYGSCNTRYDDALDRFHDNKYSDDGIIWGPRRSEGLNTLSIRSYAPNQIYFLYAERYLSSRDVQVAAQRIVGILEDATRPLCD